MRQTLLLMYCLFFSLLVTAQNPGGVGKPELWFKTKAVNTDLQGNYYWKDFSGDNLRLNVYSDEGAEQGNEFMTSSVLFINTYPALNMYKFLDTKSRNVQLKRTNLS